MPKPYYITGLENAAQAFMSGLQNREARQRREAELADARAQQKENFLLELSARQAQEGNTQAGKLLDTRLGTAAEVPTGFGALMPKDQVTNPTTLNVQQAQLLQALNRQNGQTGFSPEQPQALQKDNAVQREQERRNLTGLTQLSQGQSSPAFQGAFERFAQQQQERQAEATATAKRKAVEPVVLEAVQGVFKLGQEDLIPTEEYHKFAESYPKFLKSGDPADLYIPSQIGAGAGKKRAQELELLKREQEISRLQQEIATSRSSEELNKARAGLLAGETPEKKLADIQARARASSLGRKQGETEASLGDIASVTQNFNSIMDAYSQIPEEYRGRGVGELKGRVAAFIKSSPEVVAFEDTKNFVLANIARQLGGERGVLTDADIKRVETLLPGLADTPETAQAKLDQVQKYMDNVIRAKQRAARLPVTGLQGLTNETLNQLSNVGKPAPALTPQQSAPNLDDQAIDEKLKKLGY